MHQTAVRMQPSFKQSLARCAYTWLWRLLSPFYVLKLLWRGRKEPVYAQHIGERFGFYSTRPDHEGQYLWIHAVSLGETRAAAVLIDALRQKIPDMKLLLTHGTATGRVQGASLLREGDVQCWMPIDAPGSVRRFMQHFQPRIGLLMETEVWPNAMYAAIEQHVPVVLVNARLSERSLKGLMKVQTLLQPAYQALSAALAQSDDDAQRLKAAGVPVVEVLGNLKYDMKPDAALQDAGRRWKYACPRPIIMAASTREGEEDLLLRAWKEAPWQTLLLDQRPVLLLVPRHPQRFAQVAQMVEDAGLNLSRRSTWILNAQSSSDVRESIQNADVWLGDSLSEMPLYYGMADLVLLGGSFKCYGGQNLLEALACGCPVIMGEHTYNFKLACALAQEAGVAYRVSDVAQALLQASAWLGQAQQLRALQAKSLAFIEAHQGAANKMAVYVGKVLALTDKKG